VEGGGGGWKVCDNKQTEIREVRDIRYKNIDRMDTLRNFNILKTKRRLLYSKTQSVPRSKHFFQPGYENQSVYGVSGTSRCLF